MNNQLKIFENEQFGEIRTVIIDNEGWFVGKDVALALGYVDTDQALRSHVDKEDKLTRKIDGEGQSRNMTVINESGLYSLILSSKLPNAKKFKRWVTSEVLPQIRKTEELKNELNGVKNEVSDLKNNLPLLSVDCDEIVKTVKSVATKALGGYKETPAYKDKSLNHKVYSDIYSQLRREFQVTSYKSIKRCQLEQAKEIVKSYKLPTALADEITTFNNQVSFIED